MKRSNYNLNPTKENAENDLRARTDTKLPKFPARHILPSPTTAHVSNKWGSSSKNWTLMNIWHYELMSHPIFNLSKPSDWLINYTRSELKEVLNKFIDITFAGEDLKLECQNFVVLRLVDQKIKEGILSFSDRLELFAQQIIFYSSQGEGRAVLSKHRVCMIACGSLAEILSATSKPNDVIIISGGFSSRKADAHSETLSIDLNFNRNELTKLYRIHCPMKSIVMLEKIIPRRSEKRFQFTYIVVEGKIRRTVVQNRSFIYQQFCQDVRDTRAYARVRRGFPVPILYDADPYETFDRLKNPSFSMFSDEPCLKKRVRFFGSESENIQKSSENLYYTCPTVPNQSNNTDQPSQLYKQNPDYSSDTSVFSRSFKEKSSYDHEESESGDYIESDEEFDDASTTSGSSYTTFQDELSRSYNVRSTTQKLRRSVRRDHNMPVMLCNWLLWFIVFVVFGILIAFLASVVICIWSNLTTADSFETFNPSPTSSHQLDSTSEPTRFFDKIPQKTNQSVWSWVMVEEWMGDAFNWIDEHCGIHCFLKKAGWV